MGEYGAYKFIGQVAVVGAFALLLVVVMVVVYVKA